MKNVFSRPILPGIAGNLAGINQVKLTNILIDNGLLRCDLDPQIEFSVKQYISVTSAATHLQVEAISGDIHLTPLLYIDYGNGFSPETAFSMSKLEDSKWIALLPLPNFIKRVRLDLSEEPGTIELRHLVAQRAPVASLMAEWLSSDARDRNAKIQNKIGYAVQLLESLAHRIALGNDDVHLALLAGSIAAGLNQSYSNEPEADPAYLSWIARYEVLDDADRTWMTKQESGWKCRPLLSIVMPVYNPALELLAEAISSVVAQTYQNWELCIADDASPNPAVRALITRLAQENHRIRYVFREVNGHISAASNSAAALASGEFLVLMDNDDVLPVHALWTIAHYVNTNTNCRMLYSDEDKISTAGFRCEPYFKGAFDRFLLYGHNMFSHLGVYERKLFESVGGFREGFEGSQDYDLTLRCMEHCQETEIVHIPHVLYHWRQVQGSTSMGAGEKSYAFEAAKRAINAHFARMGYPLVSVNSDMPGVASVSTHRLQKPPFISVIIPTRDGLEFLRPCIDSLLAHPDPLSEIIIVDNGSANSETLVFLEDLAKDGNRFRIVRSDTDFNFSFLCNLGVSQAKGDIICLLNNDTELRTSEMFERARAWLSIPDVGIIGARLLYPDNTIQHFGVTTGVGNHQVAAHAHLGLPDAVHSHFSKSRLLQQFAATTGACIFLNKAVFSEVGGLDESLAVAYNDIDLCLKVRKIGLKVICDPFIKLIHKESKSRGHDSSSVEAARLNTDAAFMVKRWGPALNDPFYNPNFTDENPSFTLAEIPRHRIPWKFVDERPSNSLL